MSEIQIANMKADWTFLAKQMDKIEGMFYVTGCKYRVETGHDGKIRICTHSRHKFAETQVVSPLAAKCTIKLCPI